PAPDGPGPAATAAVPADRAGCRAPDAHPAAPDAGIPRAGQVSGVSTWCRTDWKRGRHCSQIAGSGETAMPFYWRGAGGMLGAPPIPGMMRYVLSVLQCQ